MQQKNSFILGLLFLVAACGGGGGSSSTEPTQPPVPEIQPTINSFTFLQSNNISLDEDITLELSSNGSSYSAPPSPIMLLKSTPDEKVFEDPVTTTDEISGSSLAEFNASLKRPHSSASNAFLVSGRLKIKVRTPSLVSAKSLLTFL